MSAASDAMYGRDIRCGVGGLRPGQVVTGRLLVAEAIYRRLTTPRGSLLYAPNYGIDIARYLGMESTVPNAVRIAGEVRGEVEKDDRVDLVIARGFVTQLAGATALAMHVDLEIVCGAGPFNLTLAIDRVSAQIFGLEAVAP